MPHLKSPQVETESLPAGYIVLQLHLPLKSHIRIYIYMFPKIGIPKVTMAFLEKNWGLPHLLGSRQVNNHHMHEEKQGDRLFEALFFALFQDVPKSKMGIFQYFPLLCWITRWYFSKMWVKDGRPRESREECASHVSLSWVMFTIFW